MTAPPHPLPRASAGGRSVQPLLTRLATCVGALLVVLGAASLITAPTLLLSSHVQAMSSTAQPTLRATAVHTPLETVVPSHGSHLDWRLKPTVGVGPASVAGASPDDAHEQQREATLSPQVERLDDDHQTRAPPG